MIFRFRHLLLGLLAVLLLLIAGLWLARQQLMHNVLRPWLAEEASRVLEADVNIDQLLLDWGQVELRGVQLVRGDLNARLDALRLVFTVDGLLQRRLEEVVMLRPEVHLQVSTDEPDPVAPSMALPRQAPLEVTAWSLVDGRLRVALEDENYLVQDIAASGRLGSALHFASSARVGAGEGVAVSLAGSGLWQDGLELTLETFAWGGRPLLSKPVTVRPGETDGLAVAVTLPSLTDSEVTSLFSALDRPVPWPESLQWQVSALSIDLRLAGDLELQVSTGDGTVVYEGRRWPWAAADVTLKQVEDAWRVEASFDVAAVAKATVQGTWRDETFSGRVQSSAPQPAALAATFGVKPPTEAQKARDLVLSASVHATQNQARLSEGRFSLGWSGLGQLAGRFQGDWRAGKVTTKVEGLTLTGQPGASELATASLNLSGDPAAGKWQGRWTLAADDLLGLARAAGVAAADGLPNLQALAVAGQLKIQGDELLLPEIELGASLAGQGLSGRLQSKLQITHHGQRGLSVDLRDLTLAELGYSNADGTVVAVGGRLSVAGQVRPTADQIAFDLQGRGTLNEALAGSWYGSLKDLPLEFSARGRWLTDGQVVQLERAHFDLAGLTTAELNGRITASVATLEGRLVISQLSGHFLKTLQQLGGELAPVLKDISLAGSLAVQTGITRQDEAWRLDMELLPEALAFGLRDTFRISGLHGNLPVIVQSGDLPDRLPARTGRLAWSHLTAPLVATTDGLLELKAETNSWQLVKPLEVVTAGGLARLNSLQLFWQNLTPVGEASLSIEDVELLQVSRAFDWPELGGRFSAELDGIRFSREEIVTSGGVSARAFGGGVQLQNLKVLAPLSRYPTYHADIEFRGIDLYELTSTFAFGEINGLASGHVHGLRLFDGIPSAFDARFETVESGTRNISVKAIRNLNTLSHGGLSAALSQGIYRFIDFYRYRKIGLTCSLRNDAFRLRGTARTESDKYLIDGGWLPPKIDVIVSSPVISFKEMVKRLKRIERTEH